MCGMPGMMLLFKLAVQIDGQVEPVNIECAYVSFCYEIMRDSA